MTLQPELPFVTHRNHYLFSDYYLDAAGNVRDAAGLERAVLGVNVLDPAMGSGHFLVAAADAMARFLVEKGAEGKDGNEGAADGESQVAYWRRRVAQACIYGVDLNPLAVELAKLSLWLATVSQDKPLSFLDHHLRCGNSLIGARVADLPLEPAAPAVAPRRKSAKAQAAEMAARQAGQTSMLDDSAFAGSMRTASRFMADIEQLGSETLADVHESERIYVEAVRKSTERGAAAGRPVDRAPLRLDHPGRRVAGAGEIRATRRLRPARLGGADRPGPADRG